MQVSTKIYEGDEGGLLWGGWLESLPSHWIGEDTDYPLTVPSLILGLAIPTSVLGWVPEWLSSGRDLGGNPTHMYPLRSLARDIVGDPIHSSSLPFSRTHSYMIFIDICEYGRYTRRSCRDPLTTMHPSRIDTTTQYPAAHLFGPTFTVSFSRRSGIAEAETQVNEQDFLLRSLKHERKYPEFLPSQTPLRITEKLTSGSDTTGVISRDIFYYLLVLSRSGQTLQNLTMIRS
jgi:hypothetical protein